MLTDKLSNPVEFQYDCDGIVEKSYRLNSITGQQLYKKLITLNPLLSIDTSTIEQISLHSRDGISYTTDTIVVVVNERPSNNILKLFDRSTKPTDFYNIKITDSNILYKIYCRYKPYELRWLNAWISRYNNSWAALEFGVGITQNSEYHDMYFYSTTAPKAVFESCGYQPPLMRSEYLYLYGLTVDSQFNIKKIKGYQYAYPLSSTTWKYIYGTQDIDKVYKSYGISN